MLKQELSLVGSNAFNAKINKDLYFNKNSLNFDLIGMIAWLSG